MTKMMTKLNEFEKIIGYQFKNKDILKEALTHRSYLNEKPSWGVPHNERLEFLGDAVLELVISEFLFKKYSNKPEGELTSYRAALVNYQFLSKVAIEINLNEFIFLSRGEAKDTSKAREVILANAMESVIGALYLDGGYEVTSDFARKFISVHIDEIIAKELHRDAKSMLQEIIQEKRRVTPTYRLMEEWGPDHQKRFRMGVYFGEELAAEGEGESKQEAETEAAKNALKNHVS
ncbi:MAG: Ribonuclease 3 [Parcubacteria group bacterium GW2011_GWB1_45_9]|nr:MAG: Ribonuclease 3 [Parcubacteria group bacterium GW2011_GWB1_45_9]